MSGTAQRMPTASGYSSQSSRFPWYALENRGAVAENMGGFMMGTMVQSRAREPKGAVRDEHPGLRVRRFEPPRWFIRAERQTRASSVAGGVDHDHSVRVDQPAQRHAQIIIFVKNSPFNLLHNSTFLEKKD
jgi:hypothetical protein